MPSRSAIIIAGSVVGAVVLTCVAVAVIVPLARDRKRKRASSNPRTVSVQITQPESLAPLLSYAPGHERGQSNGSVHTEEARVIAPTTAVARLQPLRTLTEGSAVSNDSRSVYSQLSADTQQHLALEYPPENDQQNVVAAERSAAAKPPTRTRTARAHAPMATLLEIPDSPSSHFQNPQSFTQNPHPTDPPLLTSAFRVSLASTPSLTTSLSPSTAPSLSLSITPSAPPSVPSGSSASTSRTPSATASLTSSSGATVHTPSPLHPDEQTPVAVTNTLLRPRSPPQAQPSESAHPYSVSTRASAGTNSKPSVTAHAHTRSTTHSPERLEVRTETQQRRELRDKPRAQLRSAPVPRMRAEPRYHGVHDSSIDVVPVTRNTVR